MAARDWDAYRVVEDASTLRVLNDVGKLDPLLRLEGRKVDREPPAALGDREVRAQPLGGVGVVRVDGRGSEAPPLLTVQPNVSAAFRGSFNTRRTRVGNTRRTRVGNTGTEAHMAVRTRQGTNLGTDAGCRRARRDHGVPKERMASELPREPDPDQSADDAKCRLPVADEEHHGCFDHGRSSFLRRIAPPLGASCSIDMSQIFRA